ncbi:hypothetical protein ACE193_08580 [Bernardetia sp. OM2101]|uniref:hypothetical protein n=1 Tax=Bernardetia sp. OM2101 TaxID=3344876 RepID=UPI0035D0EFC7
MKTKLIKFHFLILLILVVNFIITIGFDLGLNSYVRIGLKILFYGSAVIGFIVFLKPFQFITAYFSLYVVSPILFFLGIMKGFLGLIFMLFFLNSTPLYKDENYEIHPYYAIMGACCQYEVYEVYSPFLYSKGQFNYAEPINSKEEESGDTDTLDEKNISHIQVEYNTLLIKLKDSTEKTYRLY